MNTVRLSIAALVMAALGGALWWSNKSEAAKEGKPAKDAPPKILSLKEDAVEQIEIKPRDGAATVVKKASGQWQITAPKQLPADSGMVSGILSSASGLSSERVVDENLADAAAYGLNPAV